MSSNNMDKKTINPRKDTSPSNGTIQKIDYLVDRVMPPIPHLISVPSKTPYLPEFPHENQHTPFASWEVTDLQYMSLMPNAFRGVSAARGNWEEEIAALSPSSNDPKSGTVTPHSQRDPNKPRIKMSLADYKSGKRPTRPPPLPASSASQHDQAKGKAIDQTNAKSANTATPHPSKEASADVKKPTSTEDVKLGMNTGSASGVNQQNANSSRPPAHGADSQLMRSTPSHASQPEASSAADNTTVSTTRQSQLDTQNDNVVLDLDDESDPAVREFWQAASQSISGERAESESNITYTMDTRIANRNPDKVTANPLNTNSKNDPYVKLMNSQAPKANTNPMRNQVVRASPVKEVEPTPGSTFPNPLRDQVVRPVPVREAEPIPGSTLPNPLSARPNNGLRKRSHMEFNRLNANLTSAASRSNMSLLDSALESSNLNGDNRKDALPPLLSPLPPGLGSPDEGQDSFTSPARQHRGANVANNTTPPKSPRSETRDGKASKPTKLSEVESPPGSSSPLVIPAMLSPGLPQSIEYELSRMKVRHDQSGELADLTKPPHVFDPQNTVEGRHERSRRPDTPGVARKMPKPPKAGSRRRGSDASATEARMDEVLHKTKSGQVQKVVNSRVIKLKYKKRQAKSIERMLKMTPKPAPVHQEDAVRAGTEEPTNAGMGTKSSAAYAKLEGKKRRRTEEFLSEPSARRRKSTEHLEAADHRLRTPLTPEFKSSGPATAQKGLLNTPRRGGGEAMKSVAMRKVDSSDGHNTARTPQATATTMTSTPTPASAERHRNGGSNQATAHHHHHGATPSIVEGKTGEQTEKLRQQHQKYTALSLKLKREMDRLLQSKQRGPEPPTPAEQHLGVIVALEAIVAYMAAFHSQDVMAGARAGAATGGSANNNNMADGAAAARRERQRLGVSNWSDTVRLWRFVEQRAAPFAPLRAATLALGCACHEELGRALAATGDQAMYADMAGNARTRDALWRGFREACDAAASTGRAGRVAALGPWSTVEDAMRATTEALAGWAREVGADWQKKVEF